MSFPVSRDRLRDSRSLSLDSSSDGEQERGLYSGRERERERERVDTWHSDTDTFGGIEGPRDAAYTNLRANGNQGCLSQRMMKVAAIVLGISLVAITTVAILINYPTASSVFFTVFGIAAGVSLVILALHYCRKSKEAQPQKGDEFIKRMFTNSE